MVAPPSRASLVREEQASLDAAERELDSLVIDERNRAALVKREQLKHQIAQRRAAYQLEAKDLEDHRAWLAYKAQQEGLRDKAIHDEWITDDAHERNKARIYAKYNPRPKSLSQLHPDDRASYLKTRHARDANRSQVEEAKKQVARAEKALGVLKTNIDERARRTQRLIEQQADPCLRCESSALKRQVDAKTARAKAAAAVFPGRQHYGNCGVEASGQLARQAKAAGAINPAMAKDAPKDENERLLDALAAGASPGKEDPSRKGPTIYGKSRQQGSIGGTNPANRNIILERQGVEMEVPMKTTKDALSKAIKDKKGIVVSLGGYALWGKTPGVPGDHGAHAVTVTDGEFDENGDLIGVYINDTGAGKTEMQKQRYVKMQDFQKACDAHPSSHMNTTKQPIWP